MRTTYTFILILTLLMADHLAPAQADSIDIEQLAGYYDVGVKPGKPFFRSRWYTRENKLYAIFDSDIDREVMIYTNGELCYNIFFSESDLPQVLDDTTYYLILTIEGEKLENFKIKRPRREWSTDLYGARNKSLDTMAFDTERSLVNNYKTDHFTIQYSALDSALVPSVSATLENNYSRLLSDFQRQNLPHTTVRIYPELDVYHNAVLTPGAPNWQMGRAWTNDEIRMLSPITAQRISGESINISEIVLHEFVHCIHLSMISNTTRVPGWLWEGLAIYKGCCRWIENPKDLEYVKNGKYPSLKKISNDRTSQMKYELGYYLIEFIEKEYGWEKVLELIKTNGDIKKTLHVSIKQFEKEFYTFLEASF